MKAHQLKKAKRDVRRAVLALRDAMPPEERARRGTLAVNRFLALDEVRSAKTVLVFWSFGSEVPTQDLIRRLFDAKVCVALPKIVNGQIECRSYRVGDPTTSTAFGALEPAGGDVIEPDSLDVVCTPAVAFDRGGRRVGYGGGYFDRLFARTRPRTTRGGLAFSTQVVDFELPHGPFDAPIDVLVTDDEVIRWGRRG